ncbi:hypothetical protein KCMC57_64330 (plasmid) [Kitasatospora sp. CMC57]|uniref:DUF317 domain-containing protein n=1 Tax=Kitasatospora sp. CMC57 TaxID=3231513 RepID=A0AB33KF41_9ACTN
MTTADTAWPYGTDVDRDDPLTALRIPVTGTHPGHSYTATFDRESEVRPTDAEAQMIASFIEEYQDRHFGNGRWRKIQQAKPFDMDCYTTSIFHKWAADDWSYRCVTWTGGPFWAPVFPRQRGTDTDTATIKGPVTLEQLMDRIHSTGDEPWPHWAAWKAQHPEAFPQHPAQEG